MALYENFQTINWNGYVIKNLTVKLGIINHLKNIISVYSDYIVEGEDTPEDLGNKFYGDSELHWVILLMNDIIDPFFDWALPNDALSAYVTANYGVGNEHKPNHYVRDGRRVFYTPPDINNPYVGLPIGTTLVTNYEHEEFLNDEKRKIKILDKQYISFIESELKTVLSSNV